MRYEFKCLQCTETEELSVPITEYTLDSHGPSCSAHGKMNQVFNNLGLSDAHDNRGFPYLDSNMGDRPVHVESQTHRRSLMKERGLHDREPSQGTRDRVREGKRTTFYMGR